MTYESPITLIKTQTDNFIKEVNEKTDEVIFKAVVNVLPQVNKEELIKALAYDREQYSKGYKDRDSEIVRCKDCKHLNVINTENTYAICHEHDIIFEPFEDDTRTHFCSWGERREPLPQYEEWQDEFNKMCESARPKTFVADEWYRDTYGENDGK